MAQIENRSKYDYGFSALGSGGSRRRFSHRYTQSLPSHTLQLPLPLPSPSLTLTSRSSDSESTLTTPQLAYHPSLTLKIASGTESPSEVEPEFDIPTPKPKRSPNARSRIPIRIRTSGIRQRPRSSSCSTITQSSFRKAGDPRGNLVRTVLLARTTKVLSRSKPTLALSLASPLRCTSGSYMENPERIDGKLDIERRYSDGKGHYRIDAHVGLYGASSYGHGDDYPCPRTSSPALPASSQPSYASSSSFSSNSTSKRMTPKKPLMVSTSVSPSERILRSTLVRDEQRSPSHRRRHSSAVASVTNSPPPLRPHEQVLRARLERALVIADDEKSRTRRRAGSETSLLGWLWKADEDQDDYEDDDLFQLPSPSTAPPNIHAFSQIQTSIASTSSLRKTPRLHTQSQPSSYVSDYKIIHAHSPQPRHAFSLSMIPSVTDLAGEPRDNLTSSSQSSSASKMPTPPPTPPLDFDATRLSGRRRSASVSPRNTNPPNHIQFDKRGTGSPTRSQGTRSLRNRSYTQPFPDPQSEAEFISTRFPKKSGLRRSSRDPNPQTSPIVPSTPPPTSSTSEPTSPSSSTSSSHPHKFNFTQFNADTASMQCRKIDGYVSFAAVAGLKEPGIQDGSLGAGGSGSEEDGNGVGEQRGGAGWVGRLFGRSSIHS